MSEPVDASGSALADSLSAIEAAEPLVQALTNEVTKNDVANVLLHWGGLPVMADAPGEAPEMAEIADALLLNTGRMTDSNVEALFAAGRRANELGVPVVLDPVGAGATPTRETVHEGLLEEIEFAAIKGNYGEISHLAGVDAEVRGVESVGEYAEIAETARSLADATGAVVVASGATDVVAAADAAYRVSAGHEMMTEVVGTGDMLGATVAAFCAGRDDHLAASLHAALAYGIAGERAGELEYEGPASYRIAFLDSVHGLGPGDAGFLEPGDRVDGTT